MSKAQDIEEIIQEIRMVIKKTPSGKKFVYWDLSTITMEPRLFRKIINLMTDQLDDIDYDIIAGAEARGFVFGTPLAVNAEKPFAMIRKKGKLPWHVRSVTYDKEYGADTLEMNADDVYPGANVIIVDDILATGGTALAIAKMVEEAGGTVAGFIFAIVLEDLPGLQLLKEKGYKVYTPICTKEVRDDVIFYELKE